MGFDIFAWGFRGKKGSTAREAYHYSKKNCLDKDDFDPPAVLSAIPDSPDLAGVATKAVGSPESHIGGATVKAAMQVAEIIFARQIVQEVNWLATRGESGTISVYCHQKKWYWADVNSFVICHFFGANPGKEFLKSIAPGLKKTELNNFGVLAQIAIVVSDYHNKLPEGVECNLRIELRH